MSSQAFSSTTPHQPTQNLPCRTDQGRGQSTAPDLGPGRLLWIPLQPSQATPHPGTVASGGTHPVHVFVLEEKHVCIHAVLPELLHVLEPGAIAHCGDSQVHSW
jgi:hypothetical protein